MRRGETRQFTTRSVTGEDTPRSFCPNCGSPLTVQKPNRRGIAVVASSLDEPGTFQPQFEIFAADAQPWDLMDPNIAKYPQHKPRPAAT